MDTTQVAKKKRVYKFDLKQKAEFVRQVSEGLKTPSQICRENDIKLSTFLGYKKQVDPYVYYSPGRFTKHSGPSGVGQHLEDNLIMYIDELMELSHSVTTSDLVLYVLKEDQSFQDGDFEKIRWWIYRFFPRNDYCIRNQTHVAQKDACPEHVADFLIYVNTLNNRFRIYNDFLINMDETPVYYDAKLSKVISSKGAKTVNGKNGDYRVSLILAVSRSGKKLKPFLIYKGKPGKTVDKSLRWFPEDAIYACQSNSWCVEEMMLKWVEKVYRPYVLKKQNGLSHLILDDYKAHKTKAVIKAVKDTGSLLSLIVLNGTSKLQVLDVGVNKPFKDHHKSIWTQWMITENKLNDKTDRKTLAT